LDQIEHASADTECRRDEKRSRYGDSGHEHNAPAEPSSSPPDVEPVRVVNRISEWRELLFE
jgi:hypothetical protein